MDGNKRKDEKLLSSDVEGLLTENLNRLWSSLIVRTLVNSGINHFYLSPGMRNAPLIAAVANQPKAKIFMGIDERAQAYRAMGHAKASGTPGVLICTSGTALANYTPAMAEAKKSSIPMIILSADRPAELVAGDANQTVVQEHFFNNITNHYLSLSVPSEEVTPSRLSSCVANLIARSLSPRKGPVHMNLPFRGPLDDTPGKISDSYIEKIGASRSPTHYLPEVFAPESALEEVVGLLKSSASTILVLGMLPSNLKTTNIRTLIQHLQIPIYPDVTSSVKYCYCLNDKIVPAFDHPEVLEQYERNRPELIIHLGGRLVSKHYYNFLEANPDIKLVTVNDTFNHEDPSFTSAVRINANPEIFSSQLMKRLEGIKLKQDLSSCLNWRTFVDKKIAIIDDGPFCYPSISKSTIELIPQNTTLYLGNSTVIRSFDSYISPEISKNIRVVSNRGASGIEGLIASACGVNDSSSQKMLTLVLGDLSFLHDLNSLKLLSESPGKIVTIVVNNQCGGIFSLLPVARDEKLIQLLTTPHGLQFEKACDMFSIKYKMVKSTDDFKKCYQSAISDEQHVVIEALIDNQLNTKIYSQLKTVRL
jgi:2-succinyl-5-enolpyruvyl-6-hydroxy-3-cyclohexene-1-carboxylate synthase